MRYFPRLAPVKGWCRQQRAPAVGISAESGMPMLADKHRANLLHPAGRRRPLPTTPAVPWDNPWLDMPPFQRRHRKCPPSESSASGNPRQTCLPAWVPSAGTANPFHRTGRLRPDSVPRRAAGFRHRPLGKREQSQRPQIAGVRLQNLLRGLQRLGRLFVSPYAPIRSSSASSFITLLGYWVRNASRPLILAADPSAVQLRHRRYIRRDP